MPSQISPYIKSSDLKLQGLMDNVLESDGRFLMVMVAMDEDAGRFRATRGDKSSAG